MKSPFGFLGRRCGVRGTAVEALYITPPALQFLEENVTINRRRSYSARSGPAFAQSKKANLFLKRRARDILTGSLMLSEVFNSKLKRNLSASRQRARSQTQLQSKISTSE